MSRSIHETHRMIREIEREDWSSAESKEGRLNGLHEKIGRKQLTKWQIATERRMRNEARVIEEIPTATDTDEIPIRIADSAPYIHYPATPGDLRAIMKRLPRGICDGISEIVFCVDSHRELNEDSLTSDVEFDPHMGRLTLEIMRGVWTSGRLGHYLPQKMVISLFAYLYSPEVPDRGIREFLMKILSLSVLVHEIAHHHDFCRRVGRGRWLFDPDEKVEGYAGEMEYAWLHRVAVPYIEEAYPEETAELISWVEHYGGARLSLDQMAGDPRKFIFDIQESIVHLSEWVGQGMDLPTTKMKFADDLHMCEFYPEASHIIDQRLSEEPKDVEALTLRADIWNHQERYSEALALALEITRVAPDYGPAWGELWIACEGLHLWEEMLRASERECCLAENKGNLGPYMLSPVIRAKIKLGEFAGAEADIRRLEDTGYKHVLKRAKRYREELEKAMKEREGDQP